LSVPTGVLHGEIADMVRDDCEMIEIGDIDAPKEAQITLDQLMADSRPPLS
jgi:hypothetical protein